MKKIIYIINMFCAAMLLYSCTEESIGQTPTDNIPPQNVTDVRVENIAGGALLTYKLPDDEDLLCIKAYFILNNGKTAEAKASVYADTLKLMGFGDTNERLVKVIAIDRSANESAPIEVRIKPLEAPIFKVQETLKVEAAFGGINVTWQNPTESNLVINVDVLNEKNEYVNLEKIYTNVKTGVGKIRGMEAEEFQLKYYISDRWDNATAKTDIALTPMYEVRVPIKTIEPMQSHSTSVAWGWTLNRMFDDNTGTGFHTEEDGFWPHYFTFKMKLGAVKLSRVRIFQRDGYQYSHGNPKRFALYGRNDYPAAGNRVYPNDYPTVPANPDYANWIKIGEFESIKPSGMGAGINTNEDLEYAKKGEDFDVDVNTPAYQYYRVESLQSWSGMSLICFMEFQLWGSPEGFVFE